jgi:hypothetical protein
MQPIICEKHAKQQHPFFPLLLSLDAEGDLEVTSLSQVTKILQPDAHGESYSRKIWVRNYSEKHVLIHVQLDDPTKELSLNVQNEHLTPKGVGSMMLVWKPNTTRKHEENEQFTFSVSYEQFKVNPDGSWEIEQAEEETK